LKTGLVYEEGSSSGQPSNKESIKFVEKTIDNNKPVETKEDNQSPRRSEGKSIRTEFVEKINNTPFDQGIISMEEIDLLKEYNHFPVTKIFSMDIIFSALTLATKL
jgi:hypothetical protein